MQGGGEEEEEDEEIEEDEDDRKGCGYGELSLLTRRNFAQLDGRNPKFRVGELVWAKCRKSSGFPWPARVVDPNFGVLDAPGTVQPSTHLCVMFFGPSPKNRNLSWVHVDDVLQFTSNGQQNDDRFNVAHLADAISEALKELPYTRKHKRDENSIDEIKCEFPPARKRLQFADDKLTALNVKQSEMSKATLPSLPDSLPVSCAGINGAYLPKFHTVRCLCKRCRGQITFPSLTKWETHTGCKSKKWKSSVRLLDDSGTSLISWLENMTSRGMQGIAFEAQPQELAMKVHLQLPYKPVIAKWTPEKCAVCQWVEDFDYNQMLMCNRCQMAVHEECYGVRANEIGGSFICRTCETQGVERECCLCPVKGGALKPSSITGFWVHISCAWFMKEMYFKDVAKMEPACGLANIRSDRFKMRCVVCQQVHGACITCKECSTAYHATCALRAGYRLEISTVANKSGDPTIRKVSYCAQHRKPTENGRLILTALEAEAKMVDTKLESEATVSSVSTSLCTNEAFPSSMIPSAGVESKATSRCSVYDHFQHKKNRDNKEAFPHIVGGISWHSLNDVSPLTKLPESKEMLSIEERLAYLEKSQKGRICFGRSSIHNWGLFAKRDIEEGEMVVEYRGEVIRRAVADLREKRYGMQGKACYLFKVSEEVVIDATNKGNIGRLINHSCSPNCYARIFPVNKPGGSCIILITRKFVKAGDELTYDYQFVPENCKVPCSCGAPDCRKFMC